MFLMKLRTKSFGLVCAVIKSVQKRSISMSSGSIEILLQETRGFLTGPNAGRCEEDLKKLLGHWRQTRPHGCAGPQTRVVALTDAEHEEVWDAQTKQILEEGQDVVGPKG
jgi:hypothetical protein